MDRSSSSPRARASSKPPASASSRASSNVPARREPRPFCPPDDEPDDYMPPVKHHGISRDTLWKANRLANVTAQAVYDNEGFERDEPPGVTRMQKVVVNPREFWIKRHDPGEKVKPMSRNGYNDSGREITVLTNTYPIKKFPKKPVYQYELSLHHDFQSDEDPRVLKRAFNCQTRKEKLPDAIYDGARTAWSTHYIENFVEHMTFTGGKNRMVGTRNDLHGELVRVRFVCRRKVYLNVIDAWLNKKRPLDEYVIDGLNFLDHLLRHGPSQKQTVSKRAFFFNTLKDNPDTKDWEREFEWGLHSGSYAYGAGFHGFATCYQGAIQMIRPCVSGLLLNLDTAHGVFFPRALLLWICRQALDARDDCNHHRLFPIRKPNGEKALSEGQLKLQDKLRGLRVTPANYPSKYKGSYTVKRLVNDSAADYKIDYKDRATGRVTKMSVEDYYMKQYNYDLQDPNAVLVEMDRHGLVFPLECLKIEKLQRWNSKLTEQETGNMIKYTAKVPTKRLQMIMKCKRLLEHEKDPHLQNFGLEIGGNMIKTKARVLPSPEIQFGNSKHNPGTAGRWDLRGRKFFKPNKNELSHWSVGFWSGRPGYALSETQVNAWLDTFIRTWRNHGGRVRGRPGLVMQLKNEPAEAACESLYNRTKSFYNREPQLLIIIVPVNDMVWYARIKRCTDTLYGVPSQVLQSKRVIANSPQYSSNVAMKVNAKLGGVTAKVNPSDKRRGLPPKGAIIGADVTHPSPGVLTPSLVGMCISNDAHGVSYMGGGEGNGDRIEIIKDVTMRFILKPLLLEWAATIGDGKQVPSYVYYFRDGVSESEYVEIINREVPCMRKLLGECQAMVTNNPNNNVWRGKMVVVIANKRHHLRVWPNPNEKNNGDQNHNPLPGTLVDRDITSPHGYDFLLYSHTALQGTARPAHYKVMLDEIGLKPAELQNMIYEQCYMYIRSTTPVSVHPAIYYAHLITARSRHHEDYDPTDGPRSGPKVNPLTERPHKDDPKAPKEFLLPMKGTVNRLPYSMWWI